MKEIRITLRPSPEHAPDFLQHLIDSPNVNRAQAIDWNRADAETTTHLYAIDGDGSTFESLASETDGVESVSVSRTDQRTSYILLQLRDGAVPMFGVIEDAIARAGLVVRRPLVYADGKIVGHVVGEPAMLQAVLDDVPERVTVQIDQINQFPSARERPVSDLSRRQREAIETALELGYYDFPRAATHADIGDSLDCAPNTASDHLQKGEAKLVRASMSEFQIGQ